MSVIIKIFMWVFHEGMYMGGEIIGKSWEEWRVLGGGNMLDVVG